MDRSWLYAERTGQSYIDGLKNFLQVASDDMTRKDTDRMCCPCRICTNMVMFKKKEDLQLHLLVKSFMEGYTRWTCHGEDAEVLEGDQARYEARVDQDMSHGHGHGSGEDAEVLEKDQARDEVMPDMEYHLAEMVQDVHEKTVDPEDEREAKKFARLLKDSTTPLYPGCMPEHTRLSVTLDFLKIKAAHNLLDASTDEYLAYLVKVFPSGNMLPESTYEAKKLVCPLGLEVLKFDACPNDCIIYRKDYTDLHKCPICKKSRYRRDRKQDDTDEAEVTSGAPAKVVWYLPVLPRLKRLFANKKDTKLIRWHEEGIKKDGTLRHPADASQ